MTNKTNGQNGAATSAMENIFSKKSVLDFAVYAFNKMAKNPNGCSSKFSVVVGDNWRITMDSCMEENECRLVLNIYLEEKIGSRYCRIQEINTGFMDMATEYMSNGSWKSVVVYEIKNKIEKMVGRLLDSYIKDISDWSIKEWEKLTGMVYNAPIADVEVEEQTEEDIINEVVGVINANLIDDATEGQKLDWSLFNDSTMEYLFANGGPELYEKIKNGVKSRRIVEVLAYDDCFYVWYDEGSPKDDAPMLNEGETESNIWFNKISRVEYLKMSRDVSDYILENGKNSDWKKVHETLNKLVCYNWGDIEGADEKVSSIMEQLFSVYFKVDKIIKCGHGAYPTLLENALLQSKLYNVVD